MLCDTRQVLFLLQVKFNYHYILEKSRIARQEKVHKFSIMLTYWFVPCLPEGVGWEEWHSTPFAVLIYMNDIRWSESTAVFLQVK